MVAETQQYFVFPYFLLLSFVVNRSVLFYFGEDSQHLTLEDLVTIEPLIANNSGINNFSTCGFCVTLVFKVLMWVLSACFLLFLFNNINI
jgi:asparagine N-glycosylation enzyme membrane subunit Stt3